MRNRPVIGLGFLGWSNKRIGVELYADSGKRRWGRRRGSPDDGWGDLLVDHLVAEGVYEGSRVVVVALDRFTSDQEFAQITEAVMKATAEALDEAVISVPGSLSRDQTGEIKDAWEQRPRPGEDKAT